MKLEINKYEVQLMIRDYLKAYYGLEHVKLTEGQARIYAYKNGIPSSDFEVHVFLEDEEKLA